VSTISIKDQLRKKRILIADDSEMNRSILADMLGEEHEILEAEDGVQALAILRKYNTEIDLVLLDIVMPQMNGFEVLSAMKKNGWIEDIPVIMISAETASAHVERAYNLGCTDFISRPFDALVVHRRVVNTILLYAKQKKLQGIIAEQISEKERVSTLMIDILSHIVEFRNGESGQHVRHIRMLTELLLNDLLETTDHYPLQRSEISLISTASALHDIGKIAIPSEILNKPGKLTAEEFEIMKSHSVVGWQMMRDLPDYQNEKLVKTAQEICRWHHERYDGRGYPDGLRGDEIPISAQIVALADVYDALTSERVYKPPFSHDRAVDMILGGECGSFNPLLLKCLAEVSGRLKDKLQKAAQEADPVQMRSLSQEMLRHEEMSASERTLHLLEHERMKFSFFADMSQEIQFEYTLSPPMVSLNSFGAKRLDLEETILDPLNNDKVRATLNESEVHLLSQALRSSTPSQPVVQRDCKLIINGEPRWSRIIARATWSAEDPPQYTGAIGKATDIHESRMQLEALKQEASHDRLTGLLNHAAAKEQILTRIAENPNANFAMAIFDLDHFKNANDTYGHMFGDEVLKFLADKLRESVRERDTAARVGGDEFLIFLEYHGDLEPIIKRIFSSLNGGRYENFPISISMGVSQMEDVGPDYDALFHAADQALYTLKRSSRGNYQFYDQATMKDMLSVISPIERGEAEADKEGDTQP